VENDNRGRLLAFTVKFVGVANYWLAYTLFGKSVPDEFHTDQAVAIDRALNLHKGQAGFQFISICDDKKNVVVDRKRFSELSNA
jgi:hypothetical protein